MNDNRLGMSKLMLLNFFYLGLLLGLIYVMCWTFDLVGYKYNYWLWLGFYYFYVIYLSVRQLINELKKSTELQFSFSFSFPFPLSLLSSPLSTSSSFLFFLLFSLFSSNLSKSV